MARPLNATMTKTPEEIITAAKDGSDPTARKAVDRFTGCLARFVGGVGLSRTTPGARSSVIWCRCWSDHPSDRVSMRHQPQHST
ncbi:hypothetical protein HGP14_30105 [Rhizobium sp. P32RR-XVIII]|uniref:hypothetical protein n=1 Tax=Rhizobium sp. P32RR-XVIII TaxID=2726738 RepID=UPI001457599C|nr:hypothetical protein [Rhizobium sp. P32RR-XVIII]NLS07531.1 hypothetical protein [Rhizobium sp. P32RR-XVIII]